LIRRTFDHLRERFYTIDGKDPQIRVHDVTVDELREAFGRRFWTNGWELSYHYEGEDANMRRPIYLPKRECPWQQDHLRAFEIEDGVELHVHREPEPTEHPAAHLDAGEHQQYDPAIESVSSLLVDLDLTYELLNN